jgi:hypothetical protein
MSALPLKADISVPRGRNYFEYTTVIKSTTEKELSPRLPW